MGSSVWKRLEGEREEPAGKLHSVTEASAWTALGEEWVDLEVFSLSSQMFVALMEPARRVKESPMSCPSELLPGWFPRARAL